MQQEQDDLYARVSLFADAAYEDLLGTKGRAGLDARGADGGHE